MDFDLLRIIIAETQLEHSRCAELFQSFVDINCNLVVVLISLIAQSENLPNDKDMKIGNIII